MIKHSNDYLSLLTWVIMDGTIVDNSKYVPNSIKIRVQFKLSKQRKIKMLKKLLDKLKLPYTYKLCKKSGLNKLQPYYIRLYGDIARKIYEDLDFKKEFPEWILGISKRQFNVILSTILATDGCKKGNRIIWGTTNENDFNLVIVLCLFHKIKHKIYWYAEKNKSGFKNGKPQYKMGVFI